MSKALGFSYFFPGLWHFLIAVAWSLALGIYTSFSPFIWLGRLEYLIPLILTSSALFWVPDGLAKKGFMKFLHYPMPDWDVLLLGPASHRHWFTHSAVLPALCYGIIWVYPAVLEKIPGFDWFALGVSIGIGSHLFWDYVGSKTHSIIIFPYWWALRTRTSRLYLLTGAALSVVIALKLVE